ncbi:MAG: hypothetical protein WBD27_15195 [Pyrinomonadaceae bacterium]
MKYAACLVAINIVFSIGCSRPIADNGNKPGPEPEIQPTPERTKPPIADHISSFSSSQLCNRLISIDTLPTRDPTITDPIYESLIAKGEDAIPCLVERITDNTPVPDPRYSVPHWQHYAIGDTAVFILLDILSKGDDDEWERRLLESLPQKYRDEWETNGIYAYFNYVSEPKNRKELQRWWKTWLSKNKK